jgi:hypothetical protein
MENSAIRVTAIKFAMDTLISSGIAYTWEEVLAIAQKYEQFILTGK